MCRGWAPLGSQTHAIVGHEFGLHIKPDEREQLIASLRTLRSQGALGCGRL